MGVFHRVSVSVPARMGNGISNEILETLQSNGSYYISNIEDSEELVELEDDV